MKLKQSLTSLALAATLCGGAAQAAISGDVVKIGVLTDMSNVYADLSGAGSVAAARMAVEDFGGKVLGKPVQIVSADHQNKADIAAAKAREWIEREGVDMITDLVTSSIGIAVQKLASDKGVITLNVGAASVALTNEECTEFGIHYAYDTYALAVGLANPMIAAGGKKWFFITADYTFGHSLEGNTANVVKAQGGQVLGSVRHPLSSTDFSSYLLQAEASGADVIGLANAGQDFTNALRQAGEFGLGRGEQQLAGLLVFSSDVKSLGHAAAQGLQYVDSWYWDMNDETRAFSDRFMAKTKFKPTSVHAGVYSAVTNYLKAVEAAGSDSGKAVRAQFATMTMNDVYHKNATVRADGRVLHDMYLLKVKSPKEAKSEWDLANIVSTIPADQAWQPLSQSRCARLK